MLALLCAATVVSTGQWTVQQATEWGDRQHWAAGCNFIPSTAINQLEMWQEATFDAKTIDHEFALMQKTGLSRARIFLHDLAYEADPSGFKTRMKTVLSLATRHGVRIMFVFFDDCWNPHSSLGKQPDPKPGVHNSGWVQSPSADHRTWPADLTRLQTYVKDILTTFKNDKGVWMWDLYNEPGNSDYGDKSLYVLRQVFEWAQSVRPSQPLTAGAFGGGGSEIDKTCTQLSDVVTFHCYDGLDGLKVQIQFYKSLGRPVVCSEWMARTNGSRIATHLPYFKEQNVSCLQWGFVSGKTNTIYPWGSPGGGPEPAVWFHDLYRKDGTPFDSSEVGLYRCLCGTQ